MRILQYHNLNLHKNIQTPLANLFSNRKNQQEIQQGFQAQILQQKRRAREKQIRDYQSSLPSYKLQNTLSKHLVDMTLYIQHDCWKSQYIYNILNIQELGFKRVSDYLYLNQAIYALNLKHRKKQQLWPVLKYCLPVSEPQVVIGMENIYKKLDDYGLIKYQIDMQENPILKAHIDKQIVPSMQTIFWHPRLTFEQTFHFDILSYQNSINYAVIGSLGRNISKITKKVVKNLINITKNKEQYEKSKDRFIKAIKQLEMFLTQDKQYIGGENPSHMDIYLYSILCTKLKSQHFQLFLKQDIGGKIWYWLIKMRRKTHYSKERVTLI